MTDVLEEDLYPWEGPRGLPLRAKSNRQGKRKRDRWAPCRLCGTPGAFRCSRCKHWLCFQCVRFRRMTGRIGAYLAHCHPRCVRRKSTGNNTSGVDTRTPIEPDEPSDLPVSEHLPDGMGAAIP